MFSFERDYGTSNLDFLHFGNYPEHLDFTLAVLEMVVHVGAIAQPAQKSRTLTTM